MSSQQPYRGRVAPSPTGYLHLGHARTFWIARQRATDAGGVLVYRDDDLDGPRCRPEFSAAAGEDLHWLGVRWNEGPCRQSARMPLYREVLEKLRAAGSIYPCKCSRKEIAGALSAPHAGDEEPVYPGTCRPRICGEVRMANEAINWRFRVPDGIGIEFNDSAQGPQRAVAGVDFGDFLVWRKDGFPSYQLACAADDAEMGITEVVRGADLITSTFRQVLVLRALGAEMPAYYHCPLVTDEAGRRLAKRHDALTLRALRGRGLTPAEVRAMW